MKISVVFSPVTKVSCSGQERGHQRGLPRETPRYPPTAQGRRGRAEGDPAASLQRQDKPYLGLIDLQQHRAGSEAAVIEQHVSQDGQPGRGALQGPGLRLQRLLGVGGSPEMERERGG